MITPTRYLTVLFIVAANLFLSANAFSAEIDRVQLIREMPENSFREMIVFNDKAFFTSERDPRGLWQSDGTIAGTQMIKSTPDFTSMSFLTKSWGGDIALFKSSIPIVLNDHFYFLHHQRSGGDEIWKSNGTAAGTVCIKQTGSDSFGSCALLNNVMYLLGSTSLWRTNGTTVGTWKVASLIDATGLVTFKDKLYFAASDSSHDKELWVSNGTTAGTRLFVDIKTFDTTYYGEQVYTGSDSWPNNFYTHNSKLYFTANDGVHGRELWKSDGTPAGTVMVADIQPGPDGSNFTNPVAIGNHLLFSAFDNAHGQELWRTDGTQNGTILLKDLLPGVDSSNALAKLTAKMDGVLYFTTSIFGTTGDLWKTDGTGNGTEIVKDGLFNRYAGEWYSSTIDDGRFSGELDGRLYFCGHLGDFNSGLWVTDGTSTGTNPVMLSGTNRYENHHYSIPHAFVTVGDFILFFSDEAHDRIVGPNGPNKPGLFKLERGPVTTAPILQLILGQQKNDMVK